MLVADIMKTKLFYISYHTKYADLKDLLEKSNHRSYPLVDSEGTAAAILGRVRLGYSGIRIYSGIHSGYSAPGSRIARMEIQLFWNKNSSQTNAYWHYSNYSFSGLIPNERAPRFLAGSS